MDNKKGMQKETDQFRLEQNETFYLLQLSYLLPPTQLWNANGTRLDVIYWGVTVLTICIYICFTNNYQCPLGLQFLNPNKAGEMAQIMEALQSKYVPTVTSNGGESKILQKVIFDGDQLTEERARNCQ